MTYVYLSTRLNTYLCFREPHAGDDVGWTAKAAHDLQDALNLRYGSTSNAHPFIHREYANNAVTVITKRKQKSPRAACCRRASRSQGMTIC
ncbi:hypothetical protein G7K_5931-t1 [Saitoella complicata NRRL Y-17804]|uniref:Uncharacterized protein n=1 Tax=Saitoella complicata (strain BCRC 22490 / CBS 7301 / JCM 7358 / NBRC 10748 / NRRL Y-17804) TaxID=698492 RepID=A0A0E9NQZ0_SAICN|nr:hypothetical protein G7K_5931-t1 [Saitoella complicata NRRL Y-17804]